METKSTTKTSKRKKVYPSNSIFSASATVDEKHITVKLPVKVANYLDLQNKNNKVYWSPVNGVIQISVNVPNVTIPAINVENSGFLSE